MGSASGGIQFPPTPQSTSELMERIRQSHAELTDLIDGLSESQLTTAGAGGAWPIKDHLAHLAAWERIVLLRLKGRPEREHEVAGMDPAGYEAAGEATLNDAIYQLNRDRPPAQLRLAFDQATEDVLSTIAGMTWDELLRPTFPDAPDSGPLLANAAGNTYEHMIEHTVWIRAQLEAAER
jgi:hypothetical protein